MDLMLPFTYTSAKFTWSSLTVLFNDCTIKPGHDFGAGHYDSAILAGTILTLNNADSCVILHLVALHPAGNFIAEEPIDSIVVSWSRIILPNIILSTSTIPAIIPNAIPT